MPTPTYTPLATVTLGTNATSITFSNIPATYRDLVIVFNGKSTATVAARLRFNGDAGASSYGQVRMGGSAGGAFSDSAATQGFIDVANVSTTDGFQAVVQIMDYSATDKHKAVIERTQPSGLGEVLAIGGRWINTSAITSVQLYNATFTTGFTASLYGIVS